MIRQSELRHIDSTSGSGWRDRFALAAWPRSWTIAQTLTDGDHSNQLLADILPWLILLVGAVLVGGIVIYIVRRSLQRHADNAGDGFTLYDLRQLHAAGELSDEEYEKARAAMIGRLKSSTPAKPISRKVSGSSSGTGPGGSSGDDADGPPNNLRTDTEHD